MAHVLSKSHIIIQTHKDRQRNMVYFCGYTDLSTEQGGIECSVRLELLKQKDQIEIMAQIIWGMSTVPFT